MKKILLILICVLFFAAKPVQENGISFKTITIGKQIWMTENYAAQMPKSWYYDRDSVKNQKYGQLYFWSSAMSGAPRGWHLPSLDDWQQLIDNFGGDSTAAPKLFAGGASGLNLLAVGHRSANITPDEMFDLKDQFGYYWTSTPQGENTAYAIELRKRVNYVVKNHFRRANGFSVRYVRDAK